MNITKELLKKINANEIECGRLAYARLSWADRQLTLPKTFRHLPVEAILDMKVQIVYSMCGTLRAETYNNLLEALTSMYSTHVWGMAMVGRDQEGKDCLRYESPEAYAQCSA